MKIVCLTTNKIYNTVNDAVNNEDYINLAYANILNCCAGVIPTTGKYKATGEGLQWAYLDDYINNKDLPCVEYSKDNWIICLNDGRIFKTNKEACSYYKVTPSRLSIHLAGVRPSAGFNESGEKLKFKKYKKYIYEVQI